MPFWTADFSVSLLVSRSNRSNSLIEVDSKISSTNLSTDFFAESLNDQSQFPFATHDSERDWNLPNDNFGLPDDGLQPWATSAGFNFQPNLVDPISGLGIDIIPEDFTVQSANSDDRQISAGRSLASTMPRNILFTEKHISIGEFDTNNGQHAPPSAQSRRQCATGELGQVAFVSQPLGPTTLSALPRLIQLQWRCDRTDCHGQTFRTQSAWK